VWVSQRTSVNGTFDSFSTPTQFANFADDGGTGPGGADGLRTVTGRVNFANSVATAADTLPTGVSALTASRLTFPDTFTSLTTNWSTATPTYASGNSNKYWYSNYTATEDSDRPGYASTITFGTITQAIGFSGLVTFTGAGALTDGGSNSVVPTTAALALAAANSAIAAGGFATSDMGNVTTIDGAKITTGTIQSANWSTTAGGQINIAGGNMRFGGSDAPSFSVTTAGVLTATGVNVSGAITATSGTFTGALSAGTTFSVTSAGVVTATSGTIGGFTLASDAIFSGTKDTSAYTTDSITISSGGTIHTPAFYTTTSTAYFKGIVEDTAELSDGTNSKPWKTLFKTDGTGIFMEAPRFRDTGAATIRTFAYRFGALEDDIESSLGDIADSTSYGCVLPGTKIITKRGEINVEHTKEDDIIKIFNFETKKWGWSSIDEIITKKVQGWSKIETELGKKLKCSNSHLLYHPDYPNSAIAIDELGVGGELYVYEDEKLVIDKIKSIESFDEEVQVWNYELDIVHNYVSNGILSHNVLTKNIQTTLSHQYIKNKSVTISSGDLVKLNSNNELQKVTTAKDTSAVGILWEQRIVDYPSFGLKLISGEPGRIQTPPPENFVSSSFQDSFGDFIPTNETGSKEIWKVASIGDSIDYDSSGSLYTLEGFKVCNQGGDVSRGDLLCSSDTAGYLMKQPSEWVVTSFDGDNNPQYEERQSQCSYTVAKAMENVTFDSNGLAEGVYGYLYCG
jgi:hypothetical protein